MSRDKMPDEIWAHNPDNGVDDAFTIPLWRSEPFCNAVKYVRADRAPVCPSGLECSGDGRDCVGDAVCDPAPAADAELLEALKKYKRGSWFKCQNIDEMQAFFNSRLPAIRKAAKEHGYAIGVHGSERRDFDLMAMPWRENASDKDVLARAIQKAACGIVGGRFDWEDKGAGRFAASFPICWCEWHGMISAGHIDLSIITRAEAGRGE